MMAELISAAGAETPYVAVAGPESARVDCKMGWEKLLSDISGPGTDKVADVGADSVREPSSEESIETGPEGTDCGSVVGTETGTLVCTDPSSEVPPDTGSEPNGVPECRMDCRKLLSEPAAPAVGTFGTGAELASESNAVAVVGNDVGMETVAGTEIETVAGSEGFEAVPTV